MAIAGAVRLVLRAAWPAPETDPDAPVTSDAIAPIRSDRSARAALLALIAMTPAPGQAAAADPASALGDDTITVGSFDFAESRLLAEIYSQALGDGRTRVQRALRLGPREFVAPALRQRSPRTRARVRRYRRRVPTASARLNRRWTSLRPTTPSCGALAGRTVRRTGAGAGPERERVRRHREVAERFGVSAH